MKFLNKLTWEMINIPVSIGVLPKAVLRREMGKISLVTSLVFICITTNSLVNGANMVCSFQGDSSWYMCTVQSIDILTSQSDSITISGTHQPGLTNSDVDYVNFWKSQGQLITYKYIPTKLFAIFPNLQGFNSQENNLTSISSYAFQNCLSMDYINFGKENFTELPASFAEACTNLKRLNIYEFGLKTIAKTALKGLTNLRSIWVYQTDISYIEPETFTYTPSLQYIVFPNNKISSIHPDTFKGLVNLTGIAFSQNYITILPALTLVNNPFMQGISFASNLIEAIDPNFLNSFPGTQFVRQNWATQLQNNSCINIYYDVFGPYVTSDFATCFDAWNRLTTTTSTITSTTTTSTTVTSTISTTTSPKKCKKDKNPKENSKSSEEKSQ